jgi:hypothetical protein
VSTGNGPWDLDDRPAMPRAAAAISMLSTLLRRGFDFACALAGLAVLFLLGPWMLLSSAAWRIPDAQEMVRLDGRVLECRETFSAAVLVLEGHQTPFESQAGSCADGLAQEGGRAWHTSIFVAPAGLNGREAQAPIASYGLTMDGRVLRELRADLEAAQIDRTVRLCVGALGTLALIWLLVVGVRNRGGFVHLLMGEERLVRRRP